MKRNLLLPANSSLQFSFDWALGACCISIYISQKISNWWISGVILRSRWCFNFLYRESQTLLALLLSYLGPLWKCNKRVKVQASGVFFFRPTELMGQFLPLVCYRLGKSPLHLCFVRCQRGVDFGFLIIWYWRRARIQDLPVYLLLN